MQNHDIETQELWMTYLIKPLLTVRDISFKRSTIYPLRTHHVDISRIPRVVISGRLLLLLLRVSFRCRL